MVDVVLASDLDNPQLILECMNSAGRELSQADLIPKFVLMGQPPDLQEALHPALAADGVGLLLRRRLRLRQEDYNGSEFSAFMRDFLTLPTGEVPLLDSMGAVAGLYARIVLSKDNGQDLPSALAQRRSGTRCGHPRRGAQCPGSGPPVAGAAAG